VSVFPTINVLLVAIGIRVYVLDAETFPPGARPPLARPATHHRRSAWGEGWRCGVDVFSRRSGLGAAVSVRAVLRNR
jgi:hypothetical protein